MKLSYLYPHKYLDLENSLLFVVVIISRKLLEKKFVLLEELIDSIQEKEKENTKNLHTMIVPAIDFLYCLGKIRYENSSRKIILLK